jgi:hypothetical protein
MFYLFLENAPYNTEYITRLDQFRMFSISKYAGMNISNVPPRRVEMLPVGAPATAGNIDVSGR